MNLVTSPVTHIQSAQISPIFLDDGRFRRMIDTVPHIVWTADANGRIDFFNNKLMEYTGIDPDSIHSHFDLRNLIYPDDFDRTMQTWAEAVATGQIYQCEHRLCVLDGTHRWFLSRAVPMRDDDGKVVEWFGSATDIEDYKRTQSALAASEQELKSLYQNAPVGLAIFDRDLKCQRANQALADIDGYSVEEHTGRSVSELLPSAKDRNAQLLRRVFETGTLVSNAEISMEIPLPLGIRRDLRSHYFPLFEEKSDQVDSVGIVVEDVTDLKRSAEAHNLLSRELSHRIKNLFAVAAALTSLTARTATSTRQMADGLGRRLLALGRAHDLVRPHFDDGGGQISIPANLGSLLQALLEPYEDLSSCRIVIEASNIPVGSKAATAFALVIHELATNAAKYGALSTHEGHLLVRAREAGEMIEVFWNEKGGPMIEKPAERSGFGSMLATQTISGQLGGTLETQWRREGVFITLKAPRSRIAE